MPKKRKTDEPVEIPFPGKHPELQPSADPEEPVIPVEDPGLIPGEDPGEMPPYEIPAPGEGS